MKFLSMVDQLDEKVYTKMAVTVIFSPYYINYILFHSKNNIILMTLFVKVTVLVFGEDMSRDNVKITNFWRVKNGFNTLILKTAWSIAK